MKADHPGSARRVLLTAGLTLSVGVLVLQVAVLVAAIARVVHLPPLEGPWEGKEQLRAFQRGPQAEFVSPQLRQLLLFPDTVNVSVWIDQMDKRRAYLASPYGGLPLPWGSYTGVLSILIRPRDPEPLATALLKKESNAERLYDEGRRVLVQRNWLDLGDALLTTALLLVGSYLLATGRRRSLA